MGGRLTRCILSAAALSAAFAGAALATSVAPVPTVKLSSSAFGTNILADSRGLTLYHYVPDKKGRVKCTGGCAQLFPPLVVAAGAKLVAGPGLAAAKLGTIKRPDGRLQVTYNGLTLYRDYYDSSEGQANGHGQQGVWYAVTAAGRVLKARPNATPPASTPTAGAPPAQAPQPNVAAAPPGEAPSYSCLPGDNCEGFSSG